jgi:hypothetical protein
MAGGLWICRELKGKYRSFARFTVNPDPAMVKIDNALGNR